MNTNIKWVRIIILDDFAATLSKVLYTFMSTRVGSDFSNR